MFLSVAPLRSRFSDPNGLRRQETRRSMIQWWETRQQISSMQRWETRQQISSAVLRGSSLRGFLLILRRPKLAHRGVLGYMGVETLLAGSSSVLSFHGLSLTEAWSFTVTTEKPGEDRPLPLPPTTLSDQQQQCLNGIPNTGYRSSPSNGSQPVPPATPGDMRNVIHTYTKRDLEQDQQSFLNMP